MNYAKWISETEIIEPTPNDYLEDGVTLKNPSEWNEIFKMDKPLDVSIFKDYTVKYSLSSIMGVAIKIVQSWTAVYWEPEGRVAKLEGSELVFPQRNEINRKGQLVCNYINLPNSKKIEDGWLLVEDTLYPTDGKEYRETGVLIDDEKFGKKIKIVWTEVVRTKIPFTISKFELRRYLRNMGKEDELDAYLNSSPSIAHDWEDAVVLDSDDDLVVAACELFKNSLGLSEDQIDVILRGCKSDI